MKHLILLYIGFSLFTGCIALTSGFLFYLQTRSKKVLFFLLYFFIFTIKIVSTILLSYILINMGHENNLLIHFLLFIGMVVFPFLGFFVNLYSLSELNLSYKFVIYGVCALVSLLGVIITPFSFSFDYSQSIVILHSPFYLILMLTFLLLYFSALFFGFVKVLHNKIKDWKQFEWSVLIVLLLFLPVIVIDFYSGLKYSVVSLRSTEYLLYFFPLLYLILSVIHSIFFFILIGSKKAISLTDMSCFDNKMISAREKEIILLIIEGKSNKEICTDLNISLSTVKTHISNIFVKTKTHSRYEIMASFQKISDSNTKV